MIVDHLGIISYGLSVSENGAMIWATLHSRMGGHGIQSVLDLNLRYKFVSVVSLSLYFDCACGGSSHGLWPAFSAQVTHAFPPCAPVSGAMGRTFLDSVLGNLGRHLLGGVRPRALRRAFLV